MCLISSFLCRVVRPMGLGATRAEGKACEVSLWLTGHGAGRCGCQDRGQELVGPEQGVWSQRRSSDFAPGRCSAGREVVRQGAGETWRGPRGLRGREGGGGPQRRRGQRGGRTEPSHTCRDTRPGRLLPPLSGASMGAGRTPPPSAPVLRVSVPPARQGSPSPGRGPTGPHLQRRAGGC